MAQKRRGGGGGAFRPPELKGTLGTLLRTTLHQAGVVRDAAREVLGQGRARLDDVRQQRRRGDALADLGELVLDLIRKGEIDLGELPEARDLVQQLDDIDAQSGERGDDEQEPVATAPSRSRFDTRGARADDGTVGSGARWTPPKPKGERVWRPPVEDAPPVAKPAAPRKGGISFAADDDDDDLADYMHPDDVPPKEPTS
ncbi:hypothetical protein BH11MYX3_BH11MYX3_26490 [soil metagenome]